MYKFVMSKTFVWVLLSFAAAIALFTSCKDDITGQGPPDIVFPDSNISYGRYVQPLFDRSCAIPTCHSGDMPAKGLSLESYQKATEHLGIIYPGQPDASLLVLRIQGTIQPRMPLYRDPLTTNQINGIRRWIYEGAYNN